MKSSLWTQQFLLMGILFVGKLRSTLIPTAVECDYNEQICSQSYCILSKGRGKFKYLSAGCNIISELKSVKLYVELLRKLKTGEYQNTNLKVETNLCNLRDAKGRNPIMKNLITMGSTNLKRLKCPLRGNVTITRMPLLTFVVQGLIADGDYKIKIKAFTEAVLMLNMNMSIAVIS